MQIGSSVQLSSLAQVWCVPGSYPWLQDLVVLVMVPQGYSGGASVWFFRPLLQTLLTQQVSWRPFPKGSQLYAAPGRWLKFVSQYSSTASQVVRSCSASLFISVDTAARFTPPKPFSNFRNVRKISKFIWLLEPLQFPFSGGWEVPWGQSRGREWYVPSLSLWLQGGVHPLCL